MRPIVGIMSCWRDKLNGCHDACRRTWIKHMVPNLWYMFFVGQGEGILEPDEIMLNIPDDYAHLPEKSQAMRKWSLEHGYEFMFKSDRDTYLSPKRLLASGFEKHDYVGYFPFIPEGSGPGFRHHQTPEGLVPSAADTRGAYIYASGGCGYWTNKPAMEAIVAAPIDEKRLDAFGGPAEDLWISNILFPLGFRGYHNPRYMFMGTHLVGEAITVHLSGVHGYQPEWMDACHRMSAGML